jgi:hypothetical protein
LPDALSGIFFAAGLDSQATDLPVGQIRCSSGDWGENFPLVRAPNKHDQYQSCAGLVIEDQCAPIVSENFSE